MTWFLNIEYNGLPGDDTQARIEDIVREYDAVLSGAGTMIAVQPVRDMEYEFDNVTLRQRRAIDKHLRKIDTITSVSWDDDAEELIYDAQIEYIEKHFPGADTNIGWGVSDDGSVVEVASKVYGHGVLTSSMRRPSMKITHKFEEF